MIVFKKSFKTTFFKRRSNRFRLIKYQNYDIGKYFVYGIAQRCGFLEPRIFKKLKRILRKNSKITRETTILKIKNKKKRSLFGKIRNKRRYNLKRKYVRWFLLRPNYIITRKSKNARMGKGKGNFKRWLIKVHRGDLFFKAIGVFPVTLGRIFAHKVNRKLRIRIKVYFNPDHFFSFNTSKVGANLFFKRYRYM